MHAPKLCAIAVLALAAGCTNGYHTLPKGMTTVDDFYATHDLTFVTVDGRKAATRAMDDSRTIAEQDCTRAIKLDSGNLRCK